MAMDLSNLKSLLDGVEVFGFDAVSSTNDLAKENPLPNSIYIAKSQTAGRGRSGKNFFSPEGGLYFSFVQDFVMGDLPTIRAAVATTKVIQKVLGLDAKIKWVNDIFLNGKKACGILCETTEKNDKRFLVTGIGINWSEVSFPTNIAQTAVSLEQNNGLTAETVIFEIIACLKTYIVDLDFYKQHCLTLQKQVRFFDKTENCFLTGAAEDINDAGNLVVSTDGKTFVLSQGEAEIIW